MSNRFKRITRKESHFKVLGIFKNFKKGSVLDIPSGTGALAQNLKEMGFEVICGDIDTKQFKAEGIKNLYANLNKSLPFDNEQFDYIVCVAGIHRVWNLNKAIFEFNRILKPKGYLVISFPNYSNIERRIKFFFRGSVSKSVNLQIFDQHTVHPEAFFRSNLFYPQLKALLIKNNFKVIKIERDKAKKSSWIFFPLIILIKLLQFFSSKKIKNEYSLNDMCNYNILAGGNNIILVCQKGGIIEI